ncbi:MAG: SH3 domain-containing protein [Pseudomonadota bacterium]
MFRLIAVTLAALYVVFIVFGDESRRPVEVTRAEAIGVSLLSPASLDTELPDSRLFVSSTSDREAVEVAIAAGHAARAGRPRTTPVAPVSTATNLTVVEPVVTSVEAPSYWYVTGSLVNLREGPSTTNAVVGQATLGTEAEVLSDRDGWYEVRLVDSSTSGWIFGDFLNQQRPG